MKDLRRVVVTLVIGSFSFAALLGILALLGAGGFGETQGRVLLTTVIVGVESTVVLCLLALAGHRWAPLALLGGLASLIATGSALMLTWGDSAWEAEGLWKAFAISALLAGTAAQLSLLISLILRPEPASGGLGALLAGTGGAAAVVAVMAIGPILNESDPGGDYWRVFGIVAILDVLGSVVLIALGGFGRVKESISSGPSAVPPPADEVRLSPAQQRRISDYALAHGSTPNRVVEAALEAYLSRPGARPDGS